MVGRMFVSRCHPRSLRHDKRPGSVADRISAPMLQLAEAFASWNPLTLAVYLLRHLNEGTAYLPTCLPAM